MPTISPSYDVRLNVLNLANRLNYDYVDRRPRAGAAVPGIDRTALLTLNYRF